MRRSGREDTTMPLNELFILLAEGVTGLGSHSTWQPLLYYTI